MKGIVAWMVGTAVGLGDWRSRGERGLSQSTENAVLLAGAVTVAGIVIAVITAYVKNHLPS